MNRRQLFTAAIAAPLAVGQSTRTLRERLLGCWKLISWQRVNQNSRVTYPCGRRVTGRLFYDSSGRMAVQIVDLDRRRIGSAPVDHSDYVKIIGTENAAEFSSGYRAYYGAYEIDEAKHAVIHHVEGDLDPVSIGQTRVRSAEFITEDRILLTYPYLGSEDRLVWDRERP